MFTLQVALYARRTHPACHHAVPSEENMREALPDRESLMTNTGGFRSQGAPCLSQFTQTCFNALVRVDIATAFTLRKSCQPRAVLPHSPLES